MLINFTVGNFLSFKEKQILSLSAETLKELKGHLHIPYFYNSSERVLKSAALFGHNSHGKSNFLKGYKFFLDFIRNSFNLSKINSGIDVQVFQLNTSTLNEPAFFEAIFLLKDIKYRYGFEVTSDKITSEWLFYAEHQVRENYLFIRNEQDIQVSKSWNKQSENRIINQAVPFAKSQVLLLSVLTSQDDIPKMHDILNWLNKNIYIPTLTENLQSLTTNAVSIFADIKYQGQILKFIKDADLGFNTIFEKIDHSKKINKSYDDEIINLWYANEVKDFALYTKHNVYDEHYQLKEQLQFELLKNESDGSIKYFILASLVVYALKNGNLLIIDELDARLHPLLLERLVKLFHDPKLNSNGSQLIFTTHNTTILNKKLRRDQIVLVEKNEFGESSIRRLHTKVSPIRIDTSIEKDYRKGVLGGVSDSLKKQNDSPTLFD